MFSSKTIFVFITLAAMVPYSACGSRFRLDFDGDIESIREKLFIFTAHNTIRTPSLDRLHDLLDNFTRELNSTVTAYEDNFLYQKMIIFHEAKNVNLTTYRAQLADFVASRRPNTTGSELVEENHKFEDVDYLLRFCEWMLVAWDYCEKMWIVVYSVLQYCVFHFVQLVIWVLRYVNEAWINMTGGRDELLLHLREVNWPKSVEEVLSFFPRLTFCIGKNQCYTFKFPVWTILLLAYVVFLIGRTCLRLWVAISFGIIGRLCLSLWAAIPVFAKVIMVCMIIETLKLLFF
jgi:hypothetical protein